MIANEFYGEFELDIARRLRETKCPVSDRHWALLMSAFIGKLEKIFPIDLDIATGVNRDALVAAVSSEASDYTKWVDGVVNIFIDTTRLQLVRSISVICTHVSPSDPLHGIASIVRMRALVNPRGAASLARAHNQIEIEHASAVDDLVQTGVIPPQAGLRLNGAVRFITCGVLAPLHIEWNRDNFDELISQLRDVDFVRNVHSSPDMRAHVFVAAYAHKLANIVMLGLKKLVTSIGDN